MTKNKVLARALILLAIALLFVNIKNVEAASSFYSSGSYISSSSGYYTNFQTYYSSDGRLRTYWPILDEKEQCRAQQDLLLMIAPGGCQPAVVRSDLLAEQNVPVFCQVEAIKLNPLIDVKQIRNIAFRENYPAEIVGAGYHPAKAALYTHDILTGDPFLGNVGYVVLILKKQPQESKLPDFVNVTLTASVEYEAGNALGVGRAEFYLKETTDQEWEELERYKQSFWNGRFSVRAERIETEEMVLSVYSGLQKIGSFTLQRGKESNPIYVPGSYCLAGVTANYVGLETAKPKAKLEISSDAGTDVVDVYKGSKIINEKCSVKSVVVDDSGLGTGYVELRCPGRDVKLTILPREVKSFEEDVIPKDTKIEIRREAIKEETGTTSSGGSSGSSGIVVGVQRAVEGAASSVRSGVSSALERVGLKKMQEVCEVKLTSTEINGKSGLLEGYYSIRRNDKKDNWEIYYRMDTKLNPDKLEDSLNNNNALRNLKEELIRKCEGRLLKEMVYDPDVEEAFNQAIENYVKVASEYPAEKKSTVEASEPYGSVALKQAIELAKQYRKTDTQVKLMNLYIETYPDRAESENYNREISKLYTLNYDSSYENVLIGNRYYSIRLVNLEAPMREQVSADFLFGGKGINLAIGESESFETSNGGGLIKLMEASNPDYVEIEFACKDDPKIKENIAKIDSSLDERQKKKKVAEAILETMKETYSKIVNKKTIKIGEAVNVCGNQLLLQKVNLDSVAHVRINPIAGRTETVTNLSVYVGIEKRAIKLSPDKSLEIIENLNETIKKWESISNKLGKIVSGLKGACFATAGVLTVKNFIDGIDGTTLARQHAMKGTQYTPGWTRICEDAVNTGVINRPDGSKESVSYKNINECFSKEASRINADIKNREQILQNVNQEIKKVESYAVVGESSFAGGKTIDTTKAMSSYLEELKNKCKNGELSEKSCSVINGLPKPDEKGSAPYTYADLRELHYQGLLDKQGYSNSKKDLDEISKKIDANKALLDSLRGGASTAGSFYELVPGVIEPDVKGKSVSGSIGSFSQKEGKFYLAGKEVVNNQQVVNIPSDANAGMLVTSGSGANAKTYLVVGKKAGDKLEPLGVYETSLDSNNKLLEISGYYPGSKNGLNSVSNFMNNEKVGSFVDKGKVYINKIRKEDWKVRYFETGPDKGFAAIVPFDVYNGWYVRVRSNIRAGNNIPVYDSSGLPRSWYICNVGENGIIEENDDCQSVFDGISSNEPILGLDASQSRVLVQKSRAALLDANRQHGKKKITINNFDLDVGAPVSQYSGVQCQDFMSPEDCKLLFNVCDPVICPATRCDLGGKYPVSNVIQTGIIGSTLLCLPNFPEVYVPVCLTGIHAGIDSFVSILKSYRSCLEENVKEGKLVGICDQITSVYLCEFFWRQVAPVARVLLPKLVELAYGQGVRGGGEYLSVMSAWENMESSLDWFTQTYAVNSLNVYKMKSIEEAGTPVCKAFVSAKYPTKIDTLIEPESPPQFYAWFSSIKLNDATLPATAQYKVFYHIFAGKDVGIYYKVYLKNPPSSSYYLTSPYVLIDSGYISRGEYKTETKDFSAPEGYKELCISINGDEKCGFGQVSTDFAVNYLRDSYVKEQTADKNQVTSEKECISGSPSLMALAANTNPQAAVEEAAFPQIYKRGIVRICASQNPGGSTEPLRYVDVGYCGDPKLRCWLDKKSVDNAITDNSILMKNATLSEIEKMQKETLAKQGVIMLDTEAVAKIKQYNEEKDAIGKKYVNNNLVDETRLNNAKKEVSEALLRINADFGSDLDRLFLNHHKAQVILLKAELNEIVARVALNYLLSKTPAVPAVVAVEYGGGGEGGGPGVKEKTGGQVEEIYEIQLDDNSVYKNIYFKYDSNLNKWQWSFDKALFWQNVSDFDKYLEGGGVQPSQKGIKVIKGLKQIEEEYSSRGVSLDSKYAGENYLVNVNNASVETTQSKGASGGSSGPQQEVPQTQEPAKPIFILIPELDGGKPSSNIFFLYDLKNNKLTDIYFNLKEKRFYYLENTLGINFLAKDSLLSSADVEDGKDLTFLPNLPSSIDRNLITALDTQVYKKGDFFYVRGQSVADRNINRNFAYQLVVSSGYLYLYDNKNVKKENIFIKGGEVYYDNLGPDNEKIGLVKDNILDGSLTLDQNKALPLIKQELFKKLNDAKIENGKIYLSLSSSGTSEETKNSNLEFKILKDNTGGSYFYDARNDRNLLDNNILLITNGELVLRTIVTDYAAELGTPASYVFEKFGKIETKEIILYPNSRKVLGGNEAVRVRFRNAEVKNNEVYSRKKKDIGDGQERFSLKTFDDRKTYLFDLAYNEYTPFFIYNGNEIYDFFVKNKKVADITSEKKIAYVEGIKEGDLYEKEWYNCLKGARIEGDKVYCGEAQAQASK